MSFILDALKKSESDRQRQSGPALFEVRVAPPRTRLPPWAIAIVLLLVLNFGLVAWMLLRHQSHGGSPSAGALVASPTPPAAAASAPPPLAGVPPALPVVPTSAPASAAPVAGAASAPSVPPAAAPAPGSAAGTAAATSSPADTTNAEDYAPAQESPAPIGLGNHVRRGTDSGLPLYQDVSTSPGTQLPQLRLDLHVFAAHPQDRFAMINMHKVHEGDTLPEGVHVDSISPEGVVLSFNGSKFLLPRD
jgi:general secretion pathway protein B